MIMHNMIAGERGYAGTVKFRGYLGKVEALDLNLEEALDVECRYEQARQWREEYVNVENAKHAEFTKALIEVIWSFAGDNLVAEDLETPRLLNQILVRRHY